MSMDKSPTPVDLPFRFKLSMLLGGKLANNFIFSIIPRRWATNLGGGSTTNGRDSAGKRLGIKLGNGASVKVGQIIIRQRGFNYYSGDNIGVGRDHTLFAQVDGIVQFTRDYWKKRTIVGVKCEAVPEFGPKISSSITPAEIKF